MHRTEKKREEEISVQEDSLLKIILLVATYCGVIFACPLFLLRLFIFTTRVLIPLIYQVCNSIGKFIYELPKQNRPIDSALMRWRKSRFGFLHPSNLWNAIVIQLNGKKTNVIHIERVRQKRSGGICGVCSEATDKYCVYCASCRSPHHVDCWEYFGRCSIYGCGQKRYLRLKQAKPIK